MINIEHNGAIYKINPNITVNQLILDPNLIELPMKKWGVLLEAKSLQHQTHRYLQILKEKIKYYDTSSEVNSFLIGENKFWLDKATRVGLMHLANCSTEDIQLVLGDQVLTFSPEFVKEFLAKLEVYAGKCYVQTQKHLMAVNTLNNPEEVINYDYTTGYPEKIVLE